MDNIHHRNHAHLPPSILPQSELNNILRYAAGHGNLTGVQMSIKVGAKVNATDPDGMTALMYAVLGEHITNVKALIEQDADVNVVDNRSWTALMYAVYTGQLEIAIALITRGANINVTDNHGISPLMYAAQKGHTDIVKALIKQGADLKLIDNNGTTILIWAAHEGHVDTVDVLILAGSNVNTIDKRNCTALMYAIHNGHINTAYRLLSEMTPEQRDFFANISPRRNTLVADFKEALKDNANKLYNIIMPSLKLYPESVFRTCPQDIINYIQEFEALLQDFPDWYHHRVNHDLNLTIQFCLNRKTIPPVIFSQEASSKMSNKRTAEDTIEIELLSSSKRFKSNH